MNDVPSRDHRRVRVQAIVVGLVLVASGLEALALASAVTAVSDFLLGLIALAMLAAAVGAE